MQCKHHGLMRHLPQNCQRFWLRGPTTDSSSRSRHAAALLPFTVCMPNVGRTRSAQLVRSTGKLVSTTPHTLQPPAQNPSNGHLTHTPPIHTHPTHTHTLPQHTTTTTTTTTTTPPHHSTAHPFQSERQQETQARKRRSSVPPRSWGPLQEPHCCTEPPARTSDAVSTSALQGRQVAPGAVKPTPTERVRQAHEGREPKTKKTRATVQHRHPSPLIPSPPPCPVATVQPRPRHESPQNRRTATLHRPDHSTPRACLPHSTPQQNGPFASPTPLQIVARPPTPQHANPSPQSTIHTRKVVTGHAWSVGAQNSSSSKKTLGYVVCYLKATHERTRKSSEERWAGYNWRSKITTAFS